LSAPGRAAAGIHMPYVAAAVIYDSSLFGATASIIGQSYRYEVPPALGALNFTSHSFDFPKYIVPICPFTMAFRLVHCGRDGKGAGDPRLYPMDIGHDFMSR
jgi:hypothetical protein